MRPSVSDAPRFARRQVEVTEIAPESVGFYSGLVYA
jgi:hypothetical protein